MDANPGEDHIRRLVFLSTGDAKEADRVWREMVIDRRERAMDHAGE